MRVYVVVEGHSEERLAQQLLTPHLAARGVWLYPMRVPVGGGGRGGGSRWAHWDRFLRRLLREQTSSVVRVTTLLDLYAIPEDTPGYTAPRPRAGAARADRMLAAMEASIGDSRFLPYIQVHELEALLFVDLGVVADVVGSLSGRRALLRLAQDVAGVGAEEVNDGPLSAPSKRIFQCLPDFRKTLQGIDALERIGLPRLRAGCPRFGAWVDRLEGFAESSSV